jgi:alpha-tubulin suppressor-like RCC1 family protein
MGENVRGAALKADGSLWVWGCNSYGELGQNNQTTYSSPVCVVGNHSFVDFDNSAVHTMVAVKADGSTWTCGKGGYGVLGNQTNNSSVSSPVAVVGGHLFLAVAIGGDSSASSAFGLTLDRTLWSWGYNGDGTLGTNDTTHYSSPVLVAGGHLFVFVKCGGYVAGALKSDGSLWMWGLGYDSKPTVVPGHSFSAFQCGFQSYYWLSSLIGLKQDGSAWCWGDNYYGQLGDGTTISRETPTSIIGGHTFTAVGGSGNFALAMKADGRPWTWGKNSFYELGDGTATDRSSPVVVVGDHSFIQVVAGQDSCFGLKNDGSVWSWGSNSFGCLGDNSKTDRSSPVPVVGDHSFVSLGNRYALPGYSYGIQSPPGGQRALAWGDFGLTPSGDPTWGEVQVVGGWKTGPVIDTGNTLPKAVTLSETLVLRSVLQPLVQVRGAEALFASGDPYPAWQDYLGPQSRTWRYVQARVRVR